MVLFFTDTAQKGLKLELSVIVLIKQKLSLRNVRNYRMLEGVWDFLCCKVLYTKPYKKGYSLHQLRNLRTFLYHICNFPQKFLKLFVVLRFLPPTTRHDKIMSSFSCIGPIFVPLSCLPHLSNITGDSGKTKDKRRREPWKYFLSCLDKLWQF